jgi:hypothetical protein
MHTLSGLWLFRSTFNPVEQLSASVHPFVQNNWKAAGIDFHEIRY